MWLFGACCAFILTEEADADAFQPHTFKSTTSARCVEWQTEVA